jgi:hypothetical protein
LHIQTLAGEFIRQTRLVGTFQQPRTQPGMNPHHTAENSPANIAFNNYLVLLHPLCASVRLSG